MITTRSNEFFGKIFAVTALTLILTFGFAYGIAQQVIRVGANDPQIEIVENIIPILESGQDPAALAQQDPVDMQKSLTPFLIAFDQDGKLIAGSGQVDGQTPTPPQGVFDAAKNKGENRLTWQPKKGVRVAAVIKPYGGEKPGFLLVGRSLREVENRTQDLMKLAGASLAIALVVSLVVLNLLFGGKKKEEHEHAQDEHHHPHHRE